MKRASPLTARLTATIALVLFATPAAAETDTTRPAAKRATFGATVGVATGSFFRGPMLALRF